MTQYFQPVATRMSRELGSVQALNRGGPGGIAAGQVDHERIFKNISSFWQIVKEEIHGQIPGGLIIAKAILVTISR